MSKSDDLSGQHPTMHHVAALAGVSIKTVSRVINNEPNVSPDKASRVWTAAQRLNYQPNIQASNLKRSHRRSQTLGLLVGSVANPFSGAIHRAVEDVARTYGAEVFSASLDDDPNRERSIVEAFVRRRVDGLILTTATKSQAYLGVEQQHGTPLVFVDREPIGISADAVVSDNRRGAFRAVQHLIHHGHRRIAYLGDCSTIQTARERRLGFLDALSAQKISVSDTVIVEDLHDAESAYEACQRLLREDTPPTALFTSQNLVTFGALRALRKHGCHNSVALVSFDDFLLSDLLEPGVTVIAQNPRKIGTLAAERMFARLQGDQSPEETFVVPTVLIPRGSGEIHPIDSTKS